MINYVNKVLVGTSQPANLTSLTATKVSEITPANAGMVIMINAETGELIKTNANAAAATSIKLGAVTANQLQYATPAGAAATIQEIIYTDPINHTAIVNKRENAYAAATEDVLNINFTGVVPVIGYRYIVRIVYKDLYEHPGQYTHTYEIVARTAVLADLIDGFAKLINKDSRRRCVATKTATSLTLTAMSKNDNEGKESINQYSQVSMVVYLYYSNPSATGFASKIKYPMSSLVITKTAGTPGKGNAKVVRDREQAALSYRGIVNRTHFPVIKPELLVNLGKNYDSLIMEFEPMHKNAQDEFSKTKQSFEMYVENAPTTYANSALKKLIDSFTGRVALT